MSPPDRFETHVTVESGAMRHADAIERFATEHGLKLVQIELPRGAHPCQPMLSWRFDPRAAGFAKRVEDALMGVAWDDFAKEYPWLDPTLRSWVERFGAAAPMRSASQAPPPQPMP